VRAAPATAPLSSGRRPVDAHRFQAGCLYFGGKIWEDPKQNNRLYYNGGRHEFTTRRGCA
jgi:hypothetical protein